MGPEAVMQLLPSARQPGGRCSRLERGDQHGDVGQAGGIGREAFTQGRHIRQCARRQNAGDERGQFGLASPFMGQSKNVDGELAGRLLGQRGDGGLMKLAVGPEILEIGAERADRGRPGRATPPITSRGFAPQGMDHMAIIHDVAAPAITISPATLKGQQMGGPQIEVEPVIMQPG